MLEKDNKKFICLEFDISSSELDFKNEIQNLFI